MLTQLQTGGGQRSPKETPHSDSLWGFKPSTPTSTELSGAPGSTVPPAPGVLLGMLTQLQTGGGQRSPKGEPQKDRASPDIFGFLDEKNGLARGRWKNHRDLSASQ